MDTPGGEIGVSAALASKPPSVVSSPYPLPPPLVGGGPEGDRPGGRDFVREGRSITDNAPFSGVLRPAVRGTQEQWGFSSCPGPVGSEQVSDRRFLQDGNPQVSTRGYPSGRLGDLTGFTGRVFPRAGTPKGQEIPPFRLERKNVPIQCPSFRLVTSSLGFHSCYPGTSDYLQVEEHPNQHVPRRLADTGANQGGMRQTHSGSSEHHPVFRFSAELEKVVSSSNSTVYLSRNVVRHTVLSSCADRGEAHPSSLPSVFPPILGVCFSPQAVRSPWPDGVASPSPASRPPPQEVPPEKPGFSLGPDLTGMGHSYQHWPLAGRSCESLARPVLAEEGCAHLRPPSRARTFHGCFRRRVGGSCTGSDCGGHLVPSTPVLVDQPQRTRGSLPLSSRVCPSTLGKVSVVGHGQHHRGLLSESSRGDTLLDSVRESRISASTLPRLGYFSQGETRPGKNKHLGRPTESATLCDPDRMDHSASSVGTGVANLAQTSCRLVRHQVQLQTSSVRIPGSGPSGMGRGCAYSVMEGSVSLCLSSDSNPRESHSQGQIRETLSHPGGPELACPAVVSRASRALSHSSSKASVREEQAHTTQVRYSTQERPSAGPSRLALVRNKLQSQGASELVRDLVTTAHRSGTHSVYSSHWSRWVKWCKDKSICPTSPSNIDIANFLASLQAGGKAASTMRVHRAAICTTLRQLGLPSFGEDSTIRDTLKGAAVIEARNPRRCPSWDLFLVLDSLEDSPYEPISKANLKNLAFKTLFLISLASGRRLSEVNNLSGLAADIGREPDGSFSLRFLPEFLAKNQKPGDPSPIIRIPPLPSDHKLCPVRALRRYLHFTRSFRGRRRKLFLSLNPSLKADISVIALTRWVRETISLAYAGGKVGKTNPHEVRAWSASLALSLNVPFDKIMDAAYWRSPSPFIKHYLRDITRRREDGLYGFSSLAVAQRAISS